LVFLGVFLFYLIGVSENIQSQEKRADSAFWKAQGTNDKIHQHGITWKFQEKERIGQFINGDYYVIGPATIEKITPMPGNGRNGSVLNLPPNPYRSGFDSRVKNGRYDAYLPAKLPIHLKPGDSLISKISVDQIGVLPAPLRPIDKSISPVKRATVLTCLEFPPPEDAFRPSYCDREQKIFLARNIRHDLLLNIPRVKGGLDFDSKPLDPRDWAEKFLWPWVDVCSFGFDAPIEYMPNYGREVGRAVGIASLLLMLDYSKQEKERLLINFLQYGIALWGIVRSGYRGWPTHGVHGTGRKWPILFAGIMLGDEEMQFPKRKYPKVMFGEDMHTIYGNGWTGAKALYAGHVGKDGRIGKIGWGAYEHLHPSKWESNIGKNYRRCCTSLAWVGQALAARLMHAERIWDHAPFFDYVDRWMTEDDTKAIEEIKRVKGWDYSAGWARQGQAWDPFVNKMWSKYRWARP
jgi:hypothetical protein